MTGQPLICPLENFWRQLCDLEGEFIPATRATNCSEFIQSIGSLCRVQGAMNARSQGVRVKTGNGKPRNEPVSVLMAAMVVQALVTHRRERAPLFQPTNSC